MKNLKTRPLVSVLIPVYNVEPYVRKAVESILLQTYKEIELIIVDDASTDRTFSIVEELAKTDSRIKVYRNKKNVKIASTLNTAFSLSIGEYIARMDGDDISEVDRIEKKVNFLLNNPSYDLIGCSLITIDNQDNEIGRFKSLSNETLIYKTLKFSSPVSHIWVSKRSTYEVLNGYRNIPCVEDYDFLLRMKSLGLRFTNLSEYFGYKVRIGRIGNTSSTFGLTQLKMRYFAYDLYKQRIRNGDDLCSEKEISKIRSFYISEWLFSKSSSLLYQAISLKSERKYLKMSVYLLGSLISPHQTKYLLDRMILKYMSRSR